MSGRAARVRWLSRLGDQCVAHELRFAPIGVNLLQTAQPVHSVYCTRLLCVAGLLACTEEARVTAVRAAAMSAMEELAAATDKGATLSMQQQAAIKRRLRVMGDSDQSVAIASQVPYCQFPMPLHIYGNYHGLLQPSLNIGFAMLQSHKTHDW